jgi:8-hydroxy-5-deazaflavin:NADPH oxidoreductase
VWRYGANGPLDSGTYGASRFESESEEMKIGIIGAGKVGSVLAGHFVGLGHSVLVANSRGPQTLTELARETGAAPVLISEVAKGVDLLVITIPLKSVPALPKDVLSGLPAASPILDTCNYYPIRDGAIPEIIRGMTDSEWTSRVLGRPVVKACNNITAYSLGHRNLQKGSTNRVALPISGDDTRLKTIVMALVDQMGFDPYDAGGLAETWRYQGGTPAYCSDPTLAELPKQLRRADRRKAAKAREQVEKMMLKVPEFPQAEWVRLSRLLAGFDVLKPRTWLAVLHLGIALLRA